MLQIFTTQRKYNIYIYIYTQRADEIIGLSILFMPSITTGVGWHIFLQGVINSNWHLSLYDLTSLTGRYVTLVASSQAKEDNRTLHFYKGIAKMK